MRQSIKTSEKLFKNQESDIPDVQSELQNGKKPSDITQGVINCAFLQQYAQSINQEDYMLKLVSETFGQFVSKQSEMFHSCTRTLSHIERDIADLYKKFEKVKAEQKEICEHFERCFQIEETQIQSIKQKEELAQVQIELKELFDAVLQK
ncbi:Hypothetical_protein [Hexamita inflata]|uniref:Hypothetical_protein n=1 Tax=Hexamita inflata TaxID=28002 RepID=A0AA86TU61_9EUKA|nr:Hypothetical protein HINF_LOCUS16634 [Hexamita inflata]